ncbi:hypothetical protein Btru_046720 [Bulinus truncatus]|nr:hypothetical protein Btru_046720 [Bulinus truncatus]
MLFSPTRLRLGFWVGTILTYPGAFPSFLLGKQIKINFTQKRAHSVFSCCRPLVMTWSVVQETADRRKRFSCTAGFPIWAPGLSDFTFTHEFRKQSNAHIDVARVPSIGALTSCAPIVHSHQC